MNYIIVLLMLLLGGCASMPSNVTPRAVSGKVVGIVANVQVTSMQDTATTDGNTVQATISNISNDTPLIMYYRCHFYTNSVTQDFIDNAGEWNRLQLYGQQNINIVCASKLLHVHHFVLEINSIKTK